MYIIKIKTQITVVISLYSHGKQGVFQDVPSKFGRGVLILRCLISYCWLCCPECRFPFSRSHGHRWPLQLQLSESRSRTVLSGPGPWTELLATSPPEISTETGSNCLETL